MLPSFIPAVKSAMPLPNPDLILSPSGAQAARGKFFFYALVILVAVVFVWLGRQPHVQATILDWPNHSLWENVKRLVGGSDKKLQGEDEDRINFLLLGQGGALHDGPYLTDTIILASLKPSTNQVALLSIPRDLSVEVPGHGFRKINSVNAFGEEAGPGKGAELATQVVGKIFNLPIHYYVRLEFNGFSKLIDQVGGVGVNVQHGFTDPEYPDNDDGYQTVTFNPGWQTMNGERALEYVRSRHGSNGEGSDFARSKRQEQVLLALKEKLLSPSTFLNPALVIKLYRTVSESLTTNLAADEAVQLAHLARKVSQENITSRVLDANPGGLLHETTGVDNAYLLLPNAGDYSELRALAQNLFEINRVEAEGAKVELQNGTPTTGLGEATALSLKAQGFNVVNVSNAAHQDFPHTLLYDYTGGGKTLTRGVLESLFHTQAVSLERGSSEPDFRIILGADYVKPKT